MPLPMSPTHTHLKKCESKHPVFCKENFRNDVTFLVEQKTFEAKMNKLADASPVFQAMFFSSGHFTESHTWHPKIRITDISPEVFCLLLHVICFGTLELVRLKIEMMLDVYYAAHKYAIAQEQEIIKLIQRRITPENVLFVLPHAEFYGWDFVQSKCWSIIERNAKRVVESEYFMQISWETLHLILENSRLSISEFDLFRGVMNWVEVERKITPKKSIVEVLGVAVYKLRFPLMTKAEFEIVVNSGILRPGELKDLSTNFRNNSTFCHKKRKNVCACRSKRICPTCCLRSTCVLGEYPYPKLTLIVLKMIRKIFPPNARKPCECTKYKSCPTMPNGGVAQVLNAQRK